MSRHYKHSLFKKGILLVTILLLQGCISHFSPLLDEEDMEWVDGFDESSGHILESEDGRKIKIKITYTDILNKETVYTSSFYASTTNPGRATVSFECLFIDNSNATWEGYILFIKSRKGKNPLVRFSLDNLGTPNPKVEPLRLIPQVSVVKNITIEDCLILKRGLNLNVNDEEIPSTLEEVIISKHYGIISITLVDSTTYVYPNFSKPYMKLNRESIWDKLRNILSAVRLSRYELQGIPHA